jgi:hypothetical protein
MGDDDGYRGIGDLERIEEAALVDVRKVYENAVRLRPADEVAAPGGKTAMRFSPLEARDSDLRFGQLDQGDAVDKFG